MSKQRDNKNKGRVGDAKNKRTFGKVTKSELLNKSRKIRDDKRLTNEIFNEFKYYLRTKVEDRAKTQYSAEPTSRGYYLPKPKTYPPTHRTTRKFYIWLGTLLQLTEFIMLLYKENLISGELDKDGKLINIDNYLANFYDECANRFSDAEPLKIPYTGKKSEFAYLIGNLSENRLITDTNIWNNVSGVFLYYGRCFSSNGLAVLYQKGNPRLGTILQEIINKTLSKN